MHTQIFTHTHAHTPCIEIHRNLHRYERDCVRCIFMRLCFHRSAHSASLVTIIIVHHSSPFSSFAYYHRCKMIWVCMWNVNFNSWKSLQWKGPWGISPNNGIGLQEKSPPSPIDTKNGNLDVWMGDIHWQGFMGRTIKATSWTVQATTIHWDWGSLDMGRGEVICRISWHWTQFLEPINLKYVARELKMQTSFPFMFKHRNNKNKIKF